MENMENASVVHHDISYIWTRFDLRWLLTGGLAGFGAGAIMICLAAYLATFIQREPTFPAKLVGAALLGSQAMEIDSFLGQGGVAGLLIHFSLAIFFGLVFTQFVLETSRKHFLMILSVLASLAIWLFWFAMFMPSFNEPMAFLLPKGISLLLHVVFGLSFGLLIVSIRPWLCKK